MRDLSGVFWTRALGRPRKLGSFVITEREFRLQYDEDASDLPPYSLLLPTRSYAHRPHVHERNEFLDVPAFLWSKIPPPSASGEAPNIQRRMYLRSLIAAGRKPAPGIETDYEILMLSGRDGVGHLDVFRSDDDARRFYRGRRKLARSPKVISEETDLWNMVGLAVADAIDDESILDLVATAVAPTPSIAGMIPKLAVTLPDAPVWDGTVSSPGVASANGQPFVEAIVKIEPRHYPSLAALEHLAFETHRRLGFETPRTWRHTTADGLELIAIERFDRKNGFPLAMESFFSILSLAAGNRNSILTPIEGSYEMVVKAMFLRDPAVLSNPKRDIEDFIRRMAVSLLTGNGDMHLENIAVVSNGKEHRLSPVFDPAPMRAYPRHGQLSALAWFRGEPRPSIGIPGNIGDRFSDLARIAEIENDRLVELMEDVFDATADYLEAVTDAHDIQEGVKKEIINAIEPVRYRLCRHFGFDDKRGSSPSTTLGRT